MATQHDPVVRARAHWVGLDGSNYTWVVLTYGSTMTPVTATSHDWLLSSWAKCGSAHAGESRMGVGRR